MDKNREKGYVISGLILILLFMGIFSVNAAFLHSGNDFLIKVNNSVGTLNQAISGGYFMGTTNTYSSPSSLNPGHTASEIWVSVKDGEMYLLQALSSSNKLCPASPLKTSYSGPSDKSKAYHYANEIEISAGKSFQKAIDNGEFCCAPTTCASLGYECGSWSDGCGGTLNCGTCSLGYTCSNGICMCTPTTCSNLGKQCGSWPNGCGGTLNCGTCSSGYTCNANGNCVITCTPHATTACYNNDVYWYNSCGVREELKQDCGEDYCDAWGSWYCRSSTLLERKRTCYDRGCSSGVCYSNPYNEYGLSHCLSGEECKSGNCVAEGGKVICTELYNTGYLDEETYKIDLEYAAKHFSLEAIRGYQAWAIPVVKVMRKNPEETKEYIVPLVNSFMEEVAYRMDKRETGNEVGALFLDRGLPLFERIGVYMNEPDWKSLFETQINSLYLDFIESALGRNFLSTKSLIIGIFQNKENKHDDLVKTYFTEEKVKNMYYDAKEKSNGSNMEFANALLDNLEKSVEEIELMIKSMEN